MALRSVRRADAALPQAHGRQAIPLPALRPLLLALGPPGAACEASRVAPNHTPRRANRNGTSLGCVMRDTSDTYDKTVSFIFYKYVFGGKGTLESLK